MASSQPWAHLGSSGPLNETEAWDPDDPHEWDVASTCTNGETGIGGTHNMVPSGMIGEEYKMMKEAMDNEKCTTTAGTPQRDPYHGRTTEPKCALLGGAPNFLLQGCCLHLSYPSSHTLPTAFLLISGCPPLCVPSLPRQRRSTSRPYRTLREPACESFNLMVVGEAGLGKTTLLESFFKSFKDDEAAFALFERKETAVEIETRRQLADAQVQRNAAERELQAAIEKSNYSVAHAKQEEIARLAELASSISERLKELSAADERRRNELRALREMTRGLRLEMKRSADQGAFVAAAEFQLEANLMQVECDLVQGELKQMRRGYFSELGAAAVSRNIGQAFRGECLGDRSKWSPTVANLPSQRPASARRRTRGCL